MSDLSAFMVTTEKGDFVRVFGFEGEKLGKCLQAVVASINKVSLRKYKQSNCDDNIFAVTSAWRIQNLSFTLHFSN